MGASSSPVQQNGSTTHMDNSATAVLVIEDIFSLSQELISKGLSDLDLGIANSLNSLKSIQSGLRELLIAGNGGFSLLEKKNIAPN